MNKFQLQFNLIDAMYPEMPFYEKLRDTNEALRIVYDSEEYTMPNVDIAQIELNEKIQLSDRESMLIEIYMGFSIAYNILHRDLPLYRRGNGPKPSSNEIELVQKIKEHLDNIGLSEVLLGNLTEQEFNTLINQ